MHFKTCSAIDYVWAAFYKTAFVKVAKVPISEHVFCVLCEAPADVGEDNRSDRCDLRDAFGRRSGERRIN